jgi:ketosteroid isomerase-like protein
MTAWAARKARAAGDSFPTGVRMPGILFAMSEENLETVRRGYALFAAGDLEGVAALFCSEADLARAGGLGLEDSGGERRSGPDGFISASRELLDIFDDYRIDPENFIDTGEAVIVPVLISGTGKASGASLDMRLVHLWVFHGSGKVERSEVFRTVDEALAAAYGR